MNAIYLFVSILKKYKKFLPDHWWINIADNLIYFGFYLISQIKREPIIRVTSNPMIFKKTLITVQINCCFICIKNIIDMIFDI